jgi:hypothetical protein
MKNLRILLVFVTLIFFTNPLSASQMGSAAKESEEQANEDLGAFIALAGFGVLITVLVITSCHSRGSGNKNIAGAAH